MQKILVTDKVGTGRGSHNHIAYLDEENGIGFLTNSGSKATFHTHEMKWVPEQIDEQTGQVLEPGGWVILPAEDGHTHSDFFEYKESHKNQAQKDHEKVSEVISLYRESQEIEGKSKKDADESRGFYTGERQWTTQQKSKLKALGRACLTINYVGKGIDTLSGLQMQQRTDLEFLPQEESDAVVADIYTYVTKHILDSCDFHRQESKSFKDAAIGGRGSYEVFVDFDDSLLGDIKVRRLNPDDLSCGGHEEEDLADCEYLFKEKIYSKEKMKQIWPDKADDIEIDFNYYEGSNRSDSHSLRFPGRQYAHSDNRYDVTPRVLGKETVMVDLARKEYRVLECQRKVYTKKHYLVHSDTGFIYEAHGWKPKDIKAIKRDFPGFVVLERLTSYIRITRIAGNVVLSDENPADLPVNDFHIVPIYCYKEGNHYYGKIEAAKDPQREVNKRHSQLVDIINRMATYNWFFDSTTFVDKNEEEKFRSTSSIPGSQFKVTSISNVPMKEEGTKFPNEIVALLELGAQTVEQLLNINMEPSGANESGSHLLHRKEQAMAGNEFIFDALSFAKKRLGRLLIPLIQRYWTPERIYRLLASQNDIDPSQDMMLGGQPFEEWPEEEIIRALEETDVATLDVTVSETEASPSMRLSTWMVLKESVEGGMQIPQDMLIEYMPGMTKGVKQRLLESLAAQQEAESENVATQSDTEIVKTLIAKGQIPPEVAEKYGVSTQSPEGLPEPSLADSSGGYATEETPPTISPGQDSFPSVATEETYEVIDKPDGSGKIVRVIS